MSSRLQDADIQPPSCRCGDAAALGKRTVNELQPGTGHQALGRHVGKLTPGILEDVNLALVGWRKLGVPPFASEGKPSAIVGEDEARYTMAGARPDHADHAVGAGRASMLSR